MSDNFEEHDDDTSDGFCTADESESSDEDEEEIENDPYEDFNEPLYPGAPLTISESILAIFSLAIRFKITGVLLSSILSLISLHCIQPNKCVPSV